MPLRRRPVISGALSLALAALLAASLAACGGAIPAGPTPTPTPMPPAGEVLVTFRAADGRLWRQRLTDQEDVAIAREIAAGARSHMIPNGRIVRGDPDLNAGWSWHLDPADFEWADMAMEVCDGLPGHVEDGTLAGDRFCPWSAEVVAVEPLD